MLLLGIGRQTEAEATLSAMLETDDQAGLGILEVFLRSVGALTDSLNRLRAARDLEAVHRFIDEFYTSMNSEG